MTNRQITYCSLEEAWGDKIPNLYKRTDSLLPEIPFNNKDYNYESNNQKFNKPIVETFTDNIVNNQDYSCKKFYEHFIDCDKCRIKIDKILNRQNDDNDTDKKNDIFVMILFGIFILFLIDILIKYYKKK